MKHLRPLTAFLVVSLLLTFPLAGQAEVDDANNVVATYPVQAGNLGGRPSPEHQKIWASVGRLIPPSLLNLVDTLEFFEIPEKLKDEEVATDAYATLGENGTTFTLGLNLTSAVSAFIDADPDSVLPFQQTVFHEFGHVLSFQASQRDEAATGTLVIDEGTLRPRAYLNLFYDQFWKKTFPGHGPAATSDAEGSALYRKDPSQFVTEYAATGPLEDFAEAFSFFVTGEPSLGKAVKDQKLRFFAGFPELVKLREQMRQGL